MGLKSKTGGGQFEKDYDEILKKLEGLIRDSAVIKQAVEKRLGENAPERIMTLLRELVPKAIKDLGQIYLFLNKYGYNGNVEQIQKNNRSGESWPKQK